MPNDNSDHLTQFVKEKFGDTLRSVIYYEWQSFEVLYVRDDVIENYSDDQLEELHQHLTYSSYGKKAVENQYEHGELKCEIQCYDDAAEMNFLLGKGEGIIIGLEPEAFVVQQTFVGKCLEELGLTENR